jgi:RNA polymerase sigma-70 factor (ECF subfamily)
VVVNETAGLDELLVRRSQSGDRAAFEQLVRQTARLVYARVYLDAGGDRHRAEDLCQETFLTAWRRIGQVAEPAGFRTWLLTVARSVATDAHRRDTRKKRAANPRRGDPAGGHGGAANSGSSGGGASGGDGGDAAERVPDDAPTPAEAAERREAQERMLRVLRELPDEYSQPLTLRFIAGADYDTIGRQLGLSNGSLRGLLNRGMAKLRDAMRREMAE